MIEFFEKKENFENVETLTDYQINISVVEVKKDAWSWIVNIYDIENPSNKMSFQSKITFTQYDFALCEGYHFVEGTGRIPVDVFNFKIYRLNPDGNVIFNGNTGLIYEKIQAQFNRGEINIF